MSDQVHSTAPAESAVSANAAVPIPLFTEQQVEQFDADDSDAGRALGKMLASFFLYTVVVMLIVAWWTITRRN